MLRVTHTFGRHAGRTVTVVRAPARFGRAPDCEVAFDAHVDLDASGRHAEARFEEGRWWLVDLGSRNGTFVNGRRVARHPLSPGDELGFGARGPRVRVDALSSPTAHAEVVAPPAPAAPPPPGPAYVAPGAAFAAPAPGAGPERRVGRRTLALLVEQAVAAAAGRRSGRTQEIAALVDHRVAAATAPQRRIVMALFALLVLALGVVGALVFFGQRSIDEVSSLRRELARMPPEDPRRKAIEARLGTLHPSNANFGRNLYDRVRRGVFMLAVQGQGFCTAFAVRPTVLATNAHCIHAARRYESKGGTIVAVENEGRGKNPLRVTEMRPHPAYRDQDDSQLTPDVGVVTIAGRATVVLELATPEDLAAIGAGDDVYLIGFPGRLMDAQNPAATFLAANVGRVTNASGRPASHAETWLVQHDAPTTHGTSGSPVFNGKGRVVAVNAGGYLEGDDATIAGRKTEVVRASPYKFGMRVDLLHALLR